MVLLPQELVEAILDEIDPFQGKHTLCACALASTMLRDASQRRFFRSVSLKAGPGKARSVVRRRLVHFLVGLDIFTASPHLAQYVRRLSLRITYVAAANAPLASVIAMLLAMFHNVEHFEFDAGGIHWVDKSISPILKSTVLDFFLRPTLQSVCLTNTKRVPIPMIMRVLSIRTVSLTHIMLLQAGRASSSTNHVEYLTFELRNSSNVLEFLLKAKQNLRRLDLSFQYLKYSLGSLYGYKLVVLHSDALCHFGINLGRKSSFTSSTETQYSLRARA
jgi:hypothetical protein